MTDTRKEYIKTFVIRVIKGKVDKNELQQVRQNLMNYSREDWQDLKIIGKELVKEAIDEQINKGRFNQISDDWKELIQDFSHSWVNLLFAIFNEEVFYQSMLLEKQGAGLDEQTKIIKILPVISRSIDQVVARVPSSNRPSNYWKVEKSLVAKTKKIVREIKGVYFQSLLGRRWKDDEIKAKLNKFVGILESLSVEEIAVLKDKLKIFANKLVDNYAPPQIKNSPEVRQIISSSIDLMNALNDEKLWKDFVNLIAKVVKLAAQNQQIWESKDPWILLQKTGMEEEVKNLIRGYTQHLNKLAGEGTNNYLSIEREEDIIKRFNENNSNPNQEDMDLEDIWKDNLLTNSLSSSGGNLAKIPTQESLLRDFEGVFLETQSKPKWYQNPWFIGFSIVGGVIVGGLIVWWLMRRKKEKRANKESNF